MRLDDLGVSAKVWGAILLLLGAMLLVSGLTLRRAYTVQEAASARVDHARDLVERAIVWKGMTESATNRGMVIAISADAQVEAFFREASTEDATRIGKLREGITQDATSEADRLHLKKIAALGIQLLAVSKKARNADPQLGRAGATALVRDEYRPVQQQYVLEIERFVALQKAKEAEARLGASQARRTALSLGALAALIVIAIAALVAAWLVRSIKQPLARVVGLARTIATGDLTSHVEASRRDEFGELMHAIAAMNASLNRVVGQVRRSADGIATASMQIAAGNLDLSARTEQTASSLQQTAASMQHLTSTVRSNADAAHRANQLAASATQAALEGGDMVGRVVATMGEITGASQKIASIVGVIDGIAFQTNILALNAAVEAAQAGEQGRGFAVVAGEVRSLAQRSADAAKEIRGLIGLNSEKIETGAALVATTGTAMEAIVGSIARVAKILDEIVLASNEQTTGITQVNQAVAHLDEMTQRNAALVEEGAAAASSMRDQALQMTRIVETFRVTQAA